MQNKTRKLLRVGAYVLLGLAALFLLMEGMKELLVWYLLKNPVNTSSLGIIGGADGPTAVFVTHTPGLVSGPVLLSLAFAACGGVMLWKTRK